MDCNRARELLFLVIDDELEPRVRDALHAHLAECPPCADKVVFARKVVTVVRQRCSRQVAPERLRIRILGSFSHRRAESG